MGHNHSTTHNDRHPTAGGDGFGFKPKRHSFHVKSETVSTKITSLKSSSSPRHGFALFHHSVVNEEERELKKVFWRDLVSNFELDQPNIWRQILVQYYLAKHFEFPRKPHKHNSAPNSPKKRSFSTSPKSHSLISKTLSPNSEEETKCNQTPLQTVNIGETIHDEDIQFNTLEDSDAFTMEQHQESDHFNCSLAKEGADQDPGFFNVREEFIDEFIEYQIKHFKHPLRFDSVPLLKLFEEFFKHIS